MISDSVDEDVLRPFIDKSNEVAISSTLTSVTQDWRIFIVFKIFI
jgi:hypothetical protein